MNETNLRDALSEVTRHVPRVDLARDAWRRGKRRNRWRAVFAIGGVAFATGVVVIAVTSVAPTRPVPKLATSPTPSRVFTSTAPVNDARLAALYAEVRHMRLLGGRDNAPTYVRDGRLWYGAYPMMQGVSGTVDAHEVIAGNKTGWVVQLRQPEPVAGTLGPMGGDFRPFPSQDTSAPRVFAASPDGKFVAMGASLLNGDGQRLGRLPLPNIAATEAWTPAGLVYRDTAGNLWLWRAGSVVSPLPAIDEVNTDGWTISDMDGCSRVGRLLASGTLETVFEHCGENIVTLSPGWAPGPRLALADNGEVYDTASGALVQTLDLPHDMLALSDSIHLEYGGWWRGSTSNDVAPKVFFSFTVDLTNIYNDVNLEHRYESVIIGCRVTTGECGQQFRSRADAPNVPFVWR